MYLRELRGIEKAACLYIRIWKKISYLMLTRKMESTPMAYTETDLQTIEAACIALASGQRVVRLSIAGKEFEFGQAKLGELKSLRADIRNELNEATGVTTGVYVTRTSKGL